MNNPYHLSADAVRQALAPLTLRQIEQLADASGVPASTIYKIKRGETVNPGIDTVAKFIPHIGGITSAAPVTL